VEYGQVDVTNCNMETIKKGGKEGEREGRRAKRTFTFPRGSIPQHDHTPDLPKILKEAPHDPLVHLHGQLRDEDGPLVLGQLI